MQVGVMAPPKAAGCRVVAAGRDADALLTAALRAGWPGTCDDANDLAGWATALGVHGVVDLDLGTEGFLPSIGVEGDHPRSDVGQLAGSDQIHAAHGANLGSAHLSRVRPVLSRGGSGGAASRAAQAAVTFGYRRLLAVTV